MVDILFALKDEDSFCKTAMSRREDILSCIDVTIMDRSANTALPSPYSKTFPAFRAGAAVTHAAAIASTLLAGVACSSAHADQAAPASPPDTSSSASSLQEITVTAQRLELLGTASTASEGVVDDQELQLTPQYRPGQLLETVPGLVVTSHSGEGKANQYLMRGYNLDHGTDLETYVDGMPINQPTHAHGQGYTDLNFLIPELADQLSYTKGPYYATVGDFGAVGSVNMLYRNTIPDELSATAGTLGFQRILSAGSQSLGAGNLLAAVEVQHYDGPFVTPDDARKENAVLRYSEGDTKNGYSVTAMVYHQLWTSTTDIPLRAIDEGLLPNQYGTLNPTDGGRAWRSSLSVNIAQTLGSGQLTGSAFFIDNQLHLWNDFTHYLADPVHGDQEDQFENRRAYGAKVDYSLPVPLGRFENVFSMGALARDDINHLGRLPSEDRIPLPTSDDPASASNDDQVYLFAGALYVQATTHWTSQFRSVLGFRDDYQHGTDIDYLAALHATAGYTNGGTARQSLPQPKASLIFEASEQLEFYASLGRGFHSADLRGVNQDTSVDLGLPHTPLLAKQEGQEIGMRATPKSNLAFTFALYNLWEQSETVLDPDVGQDIAGPPSRRYGYEINVTYEINRHLEFYGSYSGNHTRFTHPLDDGTGHLGDYIADAPTGSGSLALYLKDLGHWSGGLDYRYLGNYPLSSGPCVNSAAVHDFPGIATSCANAPTELGQVNGKGFGEWNLDAHYAFPAGWSASLGIYNLFNTHAPAAEFWYVDRLQNEIGSYPQGRADIHEHPLEPIMARFTITKRFGS
jgi:outer membrane receptor protein involved in Fe transport